MKYTRLFTGPDEQSHFEDCEIPLAEASLGKISSAIQSANVQFGQVEGFYEIPWHNATSPHYVVILQGPIEMEVSNGIKRCFNSGDIILAEDISGKGHITRGLGEGPKQYLVIPLGEFSLTSTLDQMISAVS